MVAGFCEGPDGAEHSLVAHVGLVCARFPGPDESGSQALTGPRAQGKGLTPSGGVQASGPLCVGPGGRDGELAPTGQNAL
jgi:hypothetical protein